MKATADEAQFGRGTALANMPVPAPVAPVSTQTVRVPAQAASGADTALALLADPMPDNQAGILVALRDTAQVERAAQARQLALAAAWAAQHPEVDRAPGSVESRIFGQVVPVAGPGAPLVDEFCIAELGAALGLSTTAGEILIGDAVELLHRLPRHWSAVQALQLPGWKARKVAQSTKRLSPEAAAFVDAHFAGVAHKVGLPTLERVIAEAMRRHMPEQAAAEELARRDGRRLVVQHDQVSLFGTSLLFGELDLADALDLDAALSSRATELAELGSPASLDVRRAIALGELARADLALPLTGLPAAEFPAGDLLPSEPSAADGSTTSQHGCVGSASESLDPRTGERRSRRREVVLYLHLAADAIAGATGTTRACTHCGAVGDPRDVPPVVGRLENQRIPVSEHVIREWLDLPDATIKVQPVIDLAESIPVGAYEIPDRMREQVVLRDHHCAFPHCMRPARSCDLDHVVAWPEGATSPANLAPLCRRHHRLKTHHRWRYETDEPGVYVWTSPHGYSYRRDHTGTTDQTD